MLSCKRLHDNVYSIAESDTTSNSNSCCAFGSILLPLQVSFKSSYCFSHPLSLVHFHRWRELFSTVGDTNASSSVSFLSGTPTEGQGCSRPEVRLRWICPWLRLPWCFWTPLTFFQILLSLFLSASQLLNFSSHGHQHNTHPRKFDGHNWVSDCLNFDTDHSIYLVLGL